jgi:hypothetical protein
MTDYLTQFEVMRDLGVEYSWLFKKIETGELKIRMVGRGYPVVDKTEFERFKKTLKK